jgi:hypothetical protein
MKQSWRWYAPLDKISLCPKWRVFRGGGLARRPTSGKEALPTVPDRKND